MEKGQNVGNQHYLLFPECVSKVFFLGPLKHSIVWKRANTNDLPRLCYWALVREIAKVQIAAKVKLLRICKPWLHAPDPKHLSLFLIGRNVIYIPMKFFLPFNVNCISFYLATWQEKDPLSRDIKSFFIVPAKTMTIQNVP